MKAFKKKDLYHLKAAINGFSHEGRKIHENEIRPKQSVEKAKGWERKRALGAHSRYHQLAYTYMLGKKYSNVEKNRPLATDWHQSSWWQPDCIAETVLKICKLHGGYRIFWLKDLNKKAIVNWFETDENIFIFEPKSKNTSQNPILKEISNNLRKPLMSRTNKNKEGVSKND